MPLSLSQEKQNDIYNKIKKIFSDFNYFDALLSIGLKQLLSDVTMLEINHEFMENLHETYIADIHMYQTKEQLTILEKLKIILMTTTVYLFSLTSSVISGGFLINSIEELLKMYPHFSEQLSLTNSGDVQELNYLIQFRNYMKLALLLVPARNNKIFLLRVVERLEGSSTEYITGTGQRPAVTRRATDIFHQESGMAMVKKTSTKRTRAAAALEANGEVIQEVPKLKKTKSTTAATAVAGGGNSKTTTKQSNLSLKVSKTLPSQPPAMSMTLLNSDGSCSSAGLGKSEFASHKLGPVNVMNGNFKMNLRSSLPMTHDLENVDSLYNLSTTSSASYESSMIGDNELIPLDELEMDSSTLTLLLGEDYCESFTETLRNSGF